MFPSSRCVTRTSVFNNTTISFFLTYIGKNKGVVEDMRPLLSLLLVVFTAVNAIHDVLVKKIRKRCSSFQPEAIIDVGANTGAYSESLRKHFPKAAILMVEASTHHDSKLKTVAEELGNAEHRIAVLSSEAGTVVQWFQNDQNPSGTGNSMYRENTRFYKGVQPIERLTDTLDDIVASSFIAGKHIDIVKADVQGAELLVLSGGTKVLEQATFVQLEGSTVEFNEGGSCFFDVDAFLRSHGFFLYDIADLQYSGRLFRTAGLGQFDILYVKPTSPRLPEELQRAKFCGQGRHMMDGILKQPTMEDAFPINSPRRARSWIWGFIAGFVCCYVMQRSLGFVFGSKAVKVS